MAAQTNEERAPKATHPSIINLILMTQEYTIKQNIALVMERIEIIKKKYEERKIGKITAGVTATTSTILSGGFSIYEQYAAAGGSFAIAAIAGIVWYGLHKNSQKRKEQLDILENRKSELEEKLEII